MSWKELIERPGRPGPWGALLDESARAAHEFCAVIETFSQEEFDKERESVDPEMRSPRTIALHVCGAAHRYADYIRKARGMPFVERYMVPPAWLTTPAETRTQVQTALRYMEETLGGLDGMPYEKVRALEFVVRWGPRYDPEMIVEHAICHYLRHRRQLERWR